MGTPNDLSLAVVLAAGGGSRFVGATHKLLAAVDGDTVAGQAVRHALAARIGPVLVVTGAAELTEVLETIGPESDPAPDPTLRVVHNPSWQDGQATSLQMAISEGDRLGAEAVVVGLADQPFIDPEAWRLVAAAGAPIAIATYDGARRNPVRLHRSVWPLLPATGDEGARSVIRLHPELVEEIPCPGSAVDIDTLEDLQSWQSRSSTNSP